MKKVEFSIIGKRYEVKLEDDFANYVIEHLTECGIDSSKSSTILDMLQAYLKSLKKSFNNEKKIQSY